MLQTGVEFPSPGISVTVVDVDSTLAVELSVVVSENSDNVLGNFDFIGNELVFTGSLQDLAPYTIRLEIIATEFDGGQPTGRDVNFQFQIFASKLICPKAGTLIRVWPKLQTDSSQCFNSLTLEVQ